MTESIDQKVERLMAIALSLAGQTGESYGNPQDAVRLHLEKELEAALRTELDMQGEPVAVVDRNMRNYVSWIDGLCDSIPDGTQLYTTPQPAQSVPMPRIIHPEPHTYYWTDKELEATQSVSMPRIIHPEPHIYYWTDKELEAIHAYAQAYAAQQDAKDAELLDWMGEQLFTHHWNGVVGSGSETEWCVAPDCRHKIQYMRGNIFREALAATVNQRGAI